MLFELSFWSERHLCRINAIRLGDGPNHPAGHTRSHYARRDVPGDHTSCADHRILTDGHTAAHHCVGSDPHTILQCNGFGGTDALRPLLRVQRVTGAGQAHSL